MFLRSEGMKQGYEAELGARQSEIETAKVVLESLYMTKDTDSQIDLDDGLQQKYNSAIGSANLACTTLGDTVKTVRLAVETCINYQFEFFPLKTHHIWTPLSWLSSLRWGSKAQSCLQGKGES